MRDGAGAAGRAAPDDGEVLVTGATGGVGSVAVALLAARAPGGRRTGKVAEADYLRGWAPPGASIARSFGARQAAAEGALGCVVDAVGSHTLANACAQMRYGGAVAACGLAQGMDLPATVAPFILRGVALLGVDSVMAPPPARTGLAAAVARPRRRGSSSA